MTILDLRQVPLEEIHQLGTDLARSIEEDRDELAQHRSLRALSEDALFFKETD